MNRIQSHPVFQAILGLLVSILLVGEAAGQTRTFTVSVDPASIAENGGTSTFTVAVNTAFATDQTFVLDYNEGTASTSGTLAGGDFRLASTSLTLRAGETSVSTTVFAIDDRNDDDDETILISAIHNGSVVGTRQTITIIDDDEPPLLAVSLSHTYLIEGVDDGLTLTLRYSNNTVFETRGTVVITLSGTAENKDDYEEPEELNFDFRSSDTEKTVFLALIDDMMDEGTETIIIEVEQNDRNNDVTTTLGTWTVKIGSRVVFSLLEESDRTLLENGDELEASLLVLRSDDPVDEDQRVTLTFGGTATRGEDYRIGRATITLHVGGIGVGKNLTPLDDDLVEGDETIEITAWHYGRDIGTETITIIDDESMDVTPPTLSGATVNGSTLVLTYDEMLDGGSTPATGDFVVTVDGSAITVNGVSITGSTVTLTLATAVEANQTVTLAYTPGANPIQDAAGNDAALLSRQTVTNNTGGTTDVTPPTLSGATVNGSTLVLTYDEMLDGASVPATGDFVVTADGSAITVNGVSITGSTVTLTLATAVEAGQTVTLAYTPGANPIQDAAGNDAAALFRQEVTNNTSAQTRQILVSNSDSSVSSNDNDRYAAQGFVTGSSSYGYTVSEVRIRFGLNLETVTTAVKIRQNNNGRPGALLATLTNPNSFANDSFNTFTAPADTHLDPNTKYFFTINEGVADLGRIDYSVTTNNAESGLTGWSVDDDRLWRSSEGATSWNTSTASFIFEIRGTTVSPPPPPPPGGGGGGTRGPSQTVPNAPTNLLADGGDEQVTLTWEAPEDDSGSTITDYQYRIDQRGDWISIGSTATTHTVTGLVNGTEYVFQVRAVTAAGSSAPSNRVETTPRAAVTLLVANFSNGNNGAFNSRVYLWNPSTSAGQVTARVFTLPLTTGIARELTTAPLDLGTLEAESALNFKLVEDILIPLGIALPYTTDGGNLTLEFTIQAVDVRGTAQVFSSDFAFGTYPMQEIPSTSSGSPTVLVANFTNGNNGALHSRVYLWNPSATDGRVTARVFTLPNTGDSMRLQTVPLGILKAFSARNIKIAEDILDFFSGIALPYTDDGGNLMLEFTIEAPDVNGAAQVFSSNMAFGTYPLQEIPSTSSGSPTVLVANFTNGNNGALHSRVYLWNPSVSAGEVTVRVFTLPRTGNSSLLGTLDLGSLQAESARNLKLAKDILAPLGIALPYVTDGGNLTLEFTIQAADARGAAQVFSSDFAFGTYPMQEIPSTSSGSPTVLVANFMNGNDAALNSRVYLWNPSLRAGSVTVRVFTLPLTAGVAQELTTAPLDLGTLGAESARNLKLAEDILTPLGIPTPYVTDGGNLTLEFTIQAADVRGAAQVFSSSFAFGTVPLQVIR